MDQRMPPDAAAKALYDTDYYAWVQAQVEALRRLAASGRTDLPLDLENLAEEVSDLGANELHKAESLLEQILIHLLKLLAAPDHQAARHWRREVAAFRVQLVKRHWTGTLRRKVAEGFADTWFIARTRAVSALEADIPDIEARLPRDCPWTLDEIVAAPAPDRS